MATAPGTPPVTQDEQVPRVEQRRILREEQKRKTLEEIVDRHQKERQTLSQELRDSLKAIQLLCADRFSSLTPEQQQEDGASSAALNDTERPGEGDEENLNRERKKQALFKEPLPARYEVRLEVQRLLEVLDKEALQKVFTHRIKVEDPREIEAHQRTVELAKRDRPWRFPCKKNVEAKSELDGTAEGDIAYVDARKLGHPKLPVCYEEIKKLLDIENNPIFSETLKEWTRKEELYKSRVDSRTNQVASLKNEVYHLIGFFSVFQGVVLTAVSQSSVLYCHNKWSPIALSVLASVISTLAVIQKLIQSNNLQKNIESEEREYNTAVHVGKRIRDTLREPKGIDFFELNLEIERITKQQSKLLEKKHGLAWLYFVLVILTLVAFGVLFPVSFWSILCKPSSPPAQ